MRFRQEQDRLGWTNLMTAQALGVSERQVTRWRGGQEPRYAAVVVMARVFDRPITWFYAQHEEGVAAA